jgi:probable F420-dependent oxidoreductase
LRVGISIPQAGRLADPAAVRQVAPAAEAAGYSSLWANDRLLRPVQPRNPYPARPDGRMPESQGTSLDPIGVLTLAAAVTERIRVGTSVLVGPWYSPVVLARSLATLDHISEGRLTVGLGIGWSRDEYEAVGVHQRHLGARLEEQLDVLDAVWGPDPVVHTGARLEIAASHVGLKPVQAPRPPLLLAAFTPTGLDRVARRADGWNPAGLSLDATAHMWRAVRDLAAAHGRDPDQLELVVRANIELTDTPLGANRPTYFGTVEQVVEDLAATSQLGAHEVILAPTTDLAGPGELLDLYATLTHEAGLLTLSR